MFQKWIPPSVNCLEESNVLSTEIPKYVYTLTWRKECKSILFVLSKHKQSPPSPVQILLLNDLECILLNKKRLLKRNGWEIEKRKSKRVRQSPQQVTFLPLLRMKSMQWNGDFSLEFNDFHVFRQILLYVVFFSIAQLLVVRSKEPWKRVLSKKMELLQHWKEFCQNPYALTNELECSGCGRYISKVIMVYVCFVYKT